MRRRGYTLLELTVAVSIGTVITVVLGMALSRFQTTYYRAETALARLSSASGCLDEMKRDLRRARTVAITDGGSGLDLTFAHGKARRYRLDPKTGDMTTDDGRAWFGVFESAAFSRSGEVVAVEVALRRPRHESSQAPLLGTQVYCRGRGR